MHLFSTFFDYRGVKGFDLSGRVALVTGGGSGPGRAFCESLAEFGADIACVGRAEQKLRVTVELVSKFGHRAIAIKADVAKPDDVDHMVKEAVAKLGTRSLFSHEKEFVFTDIKLGAFALHPRVQSCGDPRHQVSVYECSAN